MCPDTNPVEVPSQPLDGFRLVFLQVQQFGEPTLGVGIALLGSFPKPLDGFRAILRHAISVLVHEAESGLGLNVTLLSSLATPLNLFYAVFRHADAVAIHNPKQTSGRGCGLDQRPSETI